jgi:hypothetical protein
MNRILLVSGDPNHGKSFLADELEANYQFTVMHVDGVYVRYVEQAYANVFLPDLHLYIAQHYQTIFALDPERQAKWHQHLLGEVVAAARRHDAVAVEGYLLYDCKDQFEVALKQQSFAVFKIRVKQRAYFLQQRSLSVSDVAMLGLNKSV